MKWAGKFPLSVLSRRDCVKLVIILLCRDLQRNHLAWRFLLLESYSHEVHFFRGCRTILCINLIWAEFSQSVVFQELAHFFSITGAPSTRLCLSLPSKWPGARGIRGDAARFTAEGLVSSLPLLCSCWRLSISPIFPKNQRSVPLILSGVFLPWLYFLLSFIISFLLLAWGLFCCYFPNFLRFWNFFNLWVYCYTFPIQLCLSCSPCISIHWFRVFQICYG